MKRAIEGRVPVDTAQKWNLDADDYQRVYAAGINAYQRSLLRFFADNGMLWPGCSVIDIGCGVGRYGRCFGELGCDVTLTDISEGMLEHAARNMDGCPGPWRTLLCDFNEICPAHPLLRQGFDLSISTMSPAIHDLETVRKMSAITRGWCFLSCFLRWKQPLRDRFYAALGLPAKHPMTGLEGQSAALLQAVAAAGYTPRTSVVPYCWADRRSPAEAAEYLLKWHGGVEEVSETLLRQAVAVAAQLADDSGSLTDAVETEVLWICWDTREK